MGLDISSKYPSHYPPKQKYLLTLPFWVRLQYAGYTTVNSTFQTHNLFPIAPRPCSLITISARAHYCLYDILLKSHWLMGILLTSHWLITIPLRAHSIPTQWTATVEETQGMMMQHQWTDFSLNSFFVLGRQLHLLIPLQC